VTRSMTKADALKLKQFQELLDALEKLLNGIEKGDVPCVDFRSACELFVRIKG